MAADELSSPLTEVESAMLLEAVRLQLSPTAVLFVRRLLFQRDALLAEVERLNGIARTAMHSLGHDTITVDPVYFLAAIAQGHAANAERLRGRLAQVEKERDHALDRIGSEPPEAKETP